MKAFSYKHKGQTIKSVVEISVVDGNLRYKVKLPDDIWYTLAPAGFTKPGEMIIWLQSNKPHETILDHHLVQSIGEGIEAME
jgi:hypothetical protein